MRNPFTSRWFSPLLIAVSVVFLYGHTLQAPFYLDDQWALQERDLLYDLPAAARNLFDQRGLTYLTFAVNVRLSGGLSLPALHLTNIALHAGCGILAWLVLRRLVAGVWWPLLGALLYVAHPLQTQAVTYLVQRAAVLGSFFFLLAFLLFLKTRQALADGVSRRSPVFLRAYGGAVLAGVCAVLAKENTAALPVVLLVWSRLFPLPQGESWGRTLRDILPFTLAPLLVGAMLLLPAAATGKSASFAVQLTSMQGNSPLNYLLTQFSVLWVYLLLLVFPVGQALEHDYPVVISLFEPLTLLAMGAWLVVAVLSWRGRHRWPLPVFGLCWFLLALAVESSIIPLDPLFEHRLHLPLFGFVLLLISAGPAMVREKAALVALLVALLVCLPLTWRRNALWNDPIALYEDNLRAVPRSERAMETLATLYGEAGRYTDERLLHEETLRYYPDNEIARGNLAKSLAEEGRWDEAYALLEEGMHRHPTVADYFETAAAMAVRQGDRARAAEYFRRGLAVAGADRSRLWNDLGVLYSEGGDLVPAEAAFRESLAADPESATAWLNLGKEYYLQQRWPEALTALRRAQELRPGDAETLEGLGLCALQVGDAATARWAAAKLRHADLQGWRRLQNEIARIDSLQAK